MSIDLDIFRRAGIDNEKDERAQKAVKAFRSLQPTLSAYARILTKNPHVSVEMAARDNGSTDGKRIFFRPPIALGDSTPHERRKCDKRDSDKQLLCVACATREHVLTTIYHEIAHICFDSFQKTSDADKATLVAEAVKEAGGKYAEAIASRINKTPSWMKDSYIAMASLISQFLPIIVNALEDARVNNKLFQARKGTKIMFDADMHKVFTEGVEQKDDAGQVIVKKWNEYPLNLQAIVGVFCKASGYDYSDWFIEQVVTALDDPALAELVKQIDTAYSAADVYHLSFPVLARLRELGFCKLETDPETKEEEDDAAKPDEAGQPSEENTGEEDGEDGDSNEVDKGSESTGSGNARGDSSESESSESENSDKEDGTGSGDAEADSGTTDEERSDDSSEEDDGDRDDQSHSDDGTDDSQDGGHDESGDSLEDGDSGTSDTDSSGKATASADNTVNDGSDSGTDSTRSDESPSESSGSSNGEGDLGEDSEGSSEGDSRTNEADSGDGDSGSGQDEAGDSSTDSSNSSDTGEFVDSGDHSGSGGREADLRPEGKEGHGDVDLADSDHSQDRESSGGDDVASVREAPDNDEEDSDEPIDTGADDGTGGTSLIDNEKNDHLPMGTPEECKYALLKWGDHEEKPKTLEEGTSENAVDRAIIQGIYFETPSRNILGVRFHHYGQPVMVNGTNMSKAWDFWQQKSLSSIGVKGDFNPDEKILGPALLRMRVAFADNQRGKESRGRKSGKVDARVLGRRAPHGDDRLFKKKTLPGKKDYFVVIGVDVSGSTVGMNILLEKRAVMAQAQLLSRMGVPFAIYAHSGNFNVPTGGRIEGLDLDIYIVKEEHEVWDVKIKERLEKLGPDSANLDGHALEFLRKRLDESMATDKIIMYYSDGKMPAENHDEELEILQRELKLCTRKGYTVMGVGIRTDSPRRHGLDTVEVNEDEDVVKVVKHLEKRLLAR